MIVFIFCVGLITGTVIAIMVNRLRHSGILRIENSGSGDAPYLLLEINGNPSGIYRKKYVTFKVKISNDDSRK